jgi:hypothetical protein
MSNPRFLDLSRIRHVQNEDPVSESVTAQPTRAIERRLQQAEQLLAERSSSETSRFVLRNVPIKTGEGAPGLWDAVYFNGATGQYEAALATVTFVEDAFQFNATALSMGLLININGDHGDVFVLGCETWTTNDNRQTTMLEPTENFQPGVPYYLSARYPGKLTRFPPALRVQMLVATSLHFVLMPSYSTPESIDHIFRLPVGMRPVGGLRPLAPDQSNHVIVGFDGLEEYDPVQQLWRSTRHSGVEEILAYGWLVADASINTTPAAPFFVRVQVATNGQITLFSAPTLAELSDNSATRFNETTLTALSSNKDTVRIYSLQDGAGTAIGQLQFRFTSNDRTYTRHAIFKIPDSFQGWKMIQAPIQPRATSTLAADAVQQVLVSEGGFGYTTPPQVTLVSDSGSGATAVAVLGASGSVVEVQVTAGGSGYLTPPTVVFDSVISSVLVQNGGSGAAATATVVDGLLATVTLTAAGSGYLSEPFVEIVDATGSGGRIQAEVQNGEVTKLTILDAGTGYTAPVLQFWPAANSGYRQTKAGNFTVVITDGAVTGITVVNGGLRYPTGATARISGTGEGAAVTPVLNATTGAITSFTIDAGGSGYDDTTTVEIDTWDPRVWLYGGSPSTAATITPQPTTLYLDRVEIDCSGIGYTAGTTVSAAGAVLGPGGAHAQLRPVLDSQGRIIKVQVLDRGHGYFAEPTLSITDAGALGNNAVLRPILGSEIVSTTVADGGSGYESTPLAKAVTPVDRVEIDSGGSGYLAGFPPAVTFSNPDDPAGVLAQGVARLGGYLDRVVVPRTGTGYALGTTVTVSGGNPTEAAEVRVLVDGGSIVSAEIINPGYGYTSAPTLTLANAGGGTGALLLPFIAGYSSGTCAVARIDLTRHGHGYAEAPSITISPPTAGTQAKAQAKLAGYGAILETQLDGEGGLRNPSTTAFVQGNALQITDFNDDLGATATRPKHASFYYNRKADPAFRLRWPSVPLSKTSFLLNGTELTVTEMQEGSGQGVDGDADLQLSNSSLFWVSCHQDGAPWDRNYQVYSSLKAAAGNDAIIPASGLPGYEDGWWRWSEHVYILATERNRGWLHVNRASRFHQSGRVASLSALSPLRLIDVATGVDAASDGSPMTGQLLLVLDNQVNILGGTRAQIDLTRTGELQMIYQNNTGRNVLVSSILLVVVHQANQGNLTPATSNSAKVTIGTQDGAYRNMIGVLSDTNTEGVACRLYARNQAKELWPDADQPVPLLSPNQALYLRVDLPAGAPIKQQVAIAYVKGHVL